MAFAFVSSTSFYNNTAGLTTINHALNGAPVKGNLLIGIVTSVGSATGCTVSDPSNGTWLPLGVWNLGTGSLATVNGQAFYVPAAVPVAATVTLTLSGGTGTISIQIKEYSYSDYLVPDGGPSYTQQSSAANVATTGTITTTGASDLVIAAMMAVTAPPSTVGAGYTARNDTNAFDIAAGTGGHDWNATEGDLLEDKLGAAAGNQTATFGTPGATDLSKAVITAFSTKPYRGWTSPTVGPSSRI